MTRNYRRRRLRKPWLYALRILLLPLFIAGLYRRGYFKHLKNEKVLRKPWRIALHVISAGISGAGGMSAASSMMSPVPVMAEENPIETAKMIANLQQTNVENPAVLKTYLVRDYAAKSEENGLQAAADNLTVQLQAPAVVTEPNLDVMKAVIAPKDDSSEAKADADTASTPQSGTVSDDSATEKDTDAQADNAQKPDQVQAPAQTTDSGDKVIDLTDVPMLDSVKPTQAETTDIKFTNSVLHLALNETCDTSVLLKQVDLTSFASSAIPDITVTSNIDTATEGFYTAVYHIKYRDGSSEDEVLPVVVAMTSEQKAAEAAKQKAERLNKMRTLSMIGTDRSSSTDTISVTSGDARHAQIMDMCSAAEGRPAGWGGVLQCTDVANWFIVNAFGKNAVHGNGRDIAGALLAQGYDDIVRVSGPAPGILFSQYSNASAMGSLYGHVGYINAVSEDGQTMYITEGQGSNGNYVEYTPWKKSEFNNTSNYCFVTTRENAEDLNLPIVQSTTRH